MTTRTFVSSHYDLIRASPLFVAEHYASQARDLPEGADLIAHYLEHGGQTHVDPGPEFDTVFYYAQTPSARRFGGPGLLHFLLQPPDQRGPVKPSGPYRWISETPEPDGDIHLERVRGVSFFNRFDLTEASVAQHGHLRAIDHLADLKLALTCNSDRPSVTIIIPVYGQMTMTLNCLESLSQQHSRRAVEIIVWDDASPEAEDMPLLAAIPWVRYMRPRENLGFLLSCNAAAEAARGEHIVLLNSDTRVCTGWLDELIDTLEERPRAGLAGSKLFNIDGSLQEAGGIVWRDGSAWNFGRDADPAGSAYSYARRADYCSGAAIAIPTAVWRRLGGFDTHFLPAYYEDVDLAFRVRQAGLEVWYQSEARVLHYEGATHGRDETVGIKAHQVTNAKKFGERWADALASHRNNGVEPFKEADRLAVGTMLAFDALTPTPDQDAGSVMTIRMLQIYQRLGWRVVFAPLEGFRYMPAYTAALQRSGIQTLQAPEISSKAAFFAFAQDFDAILGFRGLYVQPVMAELRRLNPAALFLFHDIDLHYLRMHRHADVVGGARLHRDAELMHNTELEVVVEVDCTIVPSEVERDVLNQETGLNNIVVYPYTADVVETPENWESRRHIIFVGGYRHTPNVDAVLHFCQDVWPLLHRTLPGDAKFFVVGAEAPPEILRLASDSVVVTGHLESLEPLLETCRIFVAPLRYGAGLKGKVVTALAHGVPCVASSIAVEGMRLAPGQDVLVEDEPAALATAVQRLYDDRAQWSALREAGRIFVETHFSWSAGEALALEALEKADARWRERQSTARARLVDSLKTPPPLT